MARVVLVLSLIGSAAFGHGLTAQTLGIGQSPWAPAGLWSATTFGLLVTDDRCTWRWVCPEQLGFGEREVPTWAVAPTGTVYAAALSGVATSRDRGCSFTRQAFFDATGAADVTISNGRTYVTTARFGVENGLAVSADDGITFGWTSLRQAQLFFSAARVAPSRPARVYVSAWYFEPRVTRLFVSDDGANTFTAHDVPPTLAIGAHLVVHAVDATRPDVLFASSTDDSNSPPTTALLRSDDGGAQFRQVLVAEGRVTHVVQDGTRWWASIGDRLFASTDGERFEAQLHPKQRACVARVSGETLVCGRVAGDDGFALAVVRDGGVTPALRWSQLAGPLECPRGAGAQVCSVAWQVERAELGLPVDHVASCGEAPVEPPSAPPPPKGCSSLPGAALVWGIAFFLRRAPRVDSRHAR